MLEWLKAHPVSALTIVVALLLLWRILRRYRRTKRRSRPVRLHPNLEKYGGPLRLASERRREAQKVLTTSSTPDIAGYRIVEQVEAVFVDGFARPEEALEGLKAAAAMKGANALTNVRQQRSSSGRYAASGDAVKVVALAPPGDSHAPPPESDR